MAAKFLSLSFLALAKLAAAANEYSDDQWANGASIIIYYLGTSDGRAANIVLLRFKLRH